MLAAFFLHEVTKAQRHEIFCKTNMLIIGKCFQPFELIELIEPLEHYNPIKPAKRIKLLLSSIFFTFYLNTKHKFL
jgi:hypothetical protein